MSDLNHILYTSISMILTVIGLIYLSKKLTNDNFKPLVLKISAILTVIIHYSTVYVEYFTTGTATLDKTMLLPVYPCNLAMWLLVIVAFMKNKNGKLFDFFATSTFYLGVIGGVLGIVLNEIYIGNPNLLDWSVLKGLLSHSTMLFGCLYIVVGGFLKIKVSNIFNVILGLLMLVTDGAIVILLHLIFGLDAPNSMYLLEIPFESMPWINVITIGIFALILIFIFTAIFEYFAYKKEERWHVKLKAFLDEIKLKKAK